jgi:hypothetical protein
VSALDLQANVLDRLGAGDDVFAAEASKERAVAVATALEAEEVEPKAASAEERLAALLAPVDSPAEELLAVVLPVVEYGGPRALDAIPRTLLHIARQTSVVGRESGWRAAAGALVVGRLGWAVAAYALHCARLDGLCAAWRAVPPPRYEDESPTPLLADPSLRHADAFDRDAGKAYDDYRSWLAGRELVGARYPLFAAELDDVFAEADFLLALRAEAAHRYGVYSHGFTAASVARFRGRLGDGALRAGLASLFGVPVADLEATLATAYGSVKTNPHRFDRPPAQLLPERGAA